MKNTVGWLVEQPAEQSENRLAFISHLQKGKGSISTKGFHEKHTSTADPKFIKKKADADSTSDATQEWLFSVWHTLKS